MLSLSTLEIIFLLTLMQDTSVSAQQCPQPETPIFTEQQASYVRAHQNLKQILGEIVDVCMSSNPQNMQDQILQYFKSYTPKPSPPKHKPLIISGCSGAGKGTLIKFLLERYPELFELSVSITTRKPRPGEQNGREYYFVDQEEFKKEIGEGLFEQYCEVHGNFYGTHQKKLDDIVNRGKICLLDIDLQGGQKIHAKRPDCNYIFIDVPSLQILEQRLRKRGTEPEEVIAKRMKNAKGELEVVKGLNYYGHLVNDQLVKTEREILEYINKNYGTKLSL